jgi:hypothetical protein
MSSKLSKWVSTGPERGYIDKVDGASLRIAVGPNKSWIAFDGMLAFSLLRVGRVSVTTRRLVQVQLYRDS